MKKVLSNFMLLLAIAGLILVSCEKESEKHEYTEEELAEIARQDSLRQIIPADYIITQDVEIPMNAGYGGVKVNLDPDGKLLEVLEYATTEELVFALGQIQDGAQVNHDITFFAYNYSTKYEFNEPSTTNYFGHWFDANGDVCNWGDQAYLFCEKRDTFSLDFTLGIFPDRLSTGEEYKIVEAMKYDDYKVAFLFNVKIVDEYIPEVVLVGTQQINFEAEQNNEYASTPVDVDAAAIEGGIGVGPQGAAIYGVNADGTLYLNGLTANNGCWFNADGNVCSWGDEGAAIFAEYDATNQVINVGQKPDGTVAGQSYTVRLGFVNDLKLYAVEITVGITEGEVIGYPETTLEATITLPLTVGVTAADEWLDHLIDLDTVAIYDAIGVYPGEATIYGVNASTDSLRIEAPMHTANNGCWFNAAGDVVTWGTEGITLYVEYRTDGGKIGTGQYPTAGVAGQTYYGRLAFVHETKRAEVVVEMKVE